MPCASHHAATCWEHAATDAISGLQEKARQARQSCWKVSGRYIILSSRPARSHASAAASCAPPAALFAAPRFHSTLATTSCSASVTASPTKNDVHTAVAPQNHTVPNANSTANRPDCPTAMALAARTLPVPW